MTKAKELTDCYLCGEQIEAPPKAVHPLCGECDLEFSDWFTSELTKLF